MAFATLDRALPRKRILLGRRDQLRAFLVAVFVNDIVALSCAFALAYAIRFQSNLPFFDDGQVSAESHIWLSALLLPIWLLVLGFFQLYNWHYLLGSTQEYKRILNASALVLTLLVIGTFFVPILRVSRGWLVMAWLGACLFISLGRFGLRRLAYRLRARGWLTQRALIIGTDEEARAIARQLCDTPACGVQVLGFVGDHSQLGSKLEGNLRVAASLLSLPIIVDWAEIEELIISTSALRREDLVKIFEMFGQSEQVELRFSSGLYELFTTGVRVKEIGYVPLVSMNKVRLDNVETAIKTFSDYAAALTALVALSPVFLALALLIRRDSPGPIFHRRRVLGRGGREFDAFKFRTMYVNGDEILGRYPELQQELRENHKLKEDPRITPMGRFLRKYSLDELPQLFNVLLGQMSLVGPRMISPPEAAKYDKLKLNLLTVKPGITGLWQISGRSDVSYDERVRLDMHYIRNYSVWLDLHLLLQTIPVVLKGKGAY